MRSSSSKNRTENKRRASGKETTMRVELRKSSRSFKQSNPYGKSQSKGAGHRGRSPGKSHHSSNRIRVLWYLLAPAAVIAGVVVIMLTSPEDERSAASSNRKRSTPEQGAPSEVLKQEKASSTGNTTQTSSDKTRPSETMTDKPKPGGEQTESDEQIDDTIGGEYAPVEMPDEHRRRKQDLGSPSSEMTESPGRDHLSPPLLQPDSRNIVFQSGELDGNPPDGFAGLYAYEYVEIADRDKETVSLKINQAKRTKLPQNLLPDQNFVLHLPDCERRDLVFRASMAPGLHLGHPGHALKVLINGKPIWFRSITDRSSFINALIPAAWLEPQENTLTLMNVGENPLVFDAVWLEDAEPLRAEDLVFGTDDWHGLPRYAREEIPACYFNSQEVSKTDMVYRSPASYPAETIKAALTRERALPEQISARWSFDSRYFRISYQERVIRRLLGQATGFFFNGGKKLCITDILDAGEFFCPLTHRPYPAGLGLRNFAGLFPGGTSGRLYANVTSAGGGKPLPPITWLGTIHSPEGASLFITRGTAGRGMDGLNAVLSLPWHGKTKIKETREIIPEGIGMKIPPYRLGSDAYKRSLNHRKFTGKAERMPNGRGLLKLKTQFKECVLLQMCPAGSEIPIATSGSTGQHAVKNKNKRKEKPIKPPKVSDRRADPFADMFVLSCWKDALVPLCSFYTVEKKEATKATVGGTEYVTPVRKESLYITVKYNDDTPKVGEGVALRTGYFRTSKAGKRLSFWVYPHVNEVNTGKENEGRNTGRKRTDKEKPDYVGLGIVCGVKGRAVRLKVGEWQRVSWKLPNTESGQVPKTIIWQASRKWSSFKKYKGVTYELNGIGLAAERNFPAKARVFKDEESGNMTIILLSRPGKTVCYRYTFPMDTVVNDVHYLNHDGREETCDWEYRESSQSLFIRGLQFPSEVSEKVRDKLPGRIRRVMKTKNVVPVIIKVKTEL
mgnify:CR=1 FL=1